MMVSAVIKDAMKATVKEVLRRCKLEDRML